MAKQLTKRQHTVLEAIRSWIHEQGYPPTIRELGRLLGIRSLRGVTTHLDAIAKKGFLKRESRARSIRLLDLVAPFEQALRIPVIGRVKAGEPVLASQHIEEHVIIDGRWVGTASPETDAHFALKVRGESMISAGIFEGDYVIVRQQATAANGDIVVALLGEDATVKRFYRDDNRIRLQAEHPTMPPIFVSEPQELKILGKVVAVFRQLR